MLKKIVINSFIKNTIALNHLLESMKSLPEFYNYEIFIMIGGCYELDTYVLSKEDNINYIKCNHNSIDFTGLIALLELYSDTSEYYFYMHDTCKIGPEFYKKLQSIDMDSKESMRIYRGPSMNIGIYSQKIINHFKEFLLQQKNKLESESMNFKVRAIQTEDHIFKNDPTNFTLDNYTGYNFTGPTDYYNTGTARIVEHYRNIDLYKIKGNWGYKITLDI
jgi:hypothetical protein